MAILKLPNEGDTHTGRISGCSLVEGKFGPQIRFTFHESGDDLYLAQKSADGQLKRIPLTYAECVGETLTFSRDHNATMPDKPYWSIKLASPGDTEKPSGKRIETPYAPPKKGKPLPFDEESFPSEAHGESVADPLPPVPEWVEEPKAKPRELLPEAMKKAAIAKGYVDLFAWMKAHLPQGTEDAAVQSATATVWISWGNKGLQP